MSLIGKINAAVDERVQTADPWRSKLAGLRGVAGGEEPYRRRRRIVGMWKGPVWGPFVFQIVGSERLVGDFGVGAIGAGEPVSFTTEFEQLDAVVRADLVSEVVEEFEHREGLLRRPIGRDFEVDGERQAGRGLGLFGDHGLVPRRWRPRFAERSVASLRR